MASIDHLHEAEQLTCPKCEGEPTMSERNPRLGKPPDEAPYGKHPGDEGHLLAEPSRKWSVHFCGPWGDCHLAGFRIHINTPRGHLAIGTPMQLRDRDGIYRNRWGPISWVPHDTRDPLDYKDGRGDYYRASAAVAESGQSDRMPPTQAIEWRLNQLIEEYGDGALASISIPDLAEWLTHERKGWPSVAPPEGTDTSIRNEPPLASVTYNVSGQAVPGSIVTNRGAAPVQQPSVEALAGLDLRCQNYVGPDYKRGFDLCAGKRLRGGKYTADQWCLPCEIRARIGAAPLASLHEAPSSPQETDG